MKRTKLRECEDCSACCGPVLRINDRDLAKAEHETCPYLRAPGCSRWNTGLPRTCRQFLCDFLVDPRVRVPQDRPDRTGIIVQSGFEEGTLVAECQPDALQGFDLRSYWGRVILSNLRAGHPIIIAFHADPYGGDAFRLCWRHGRIGCELTCCDQSGSPLLLPVHPVYERPLQQTLFIPQQNYAIDADLLIRHLAGAEMRILAPSAGKTRVRFRVTRRQVAFLQVVRDALTLADGPTQLRGLADGSRFSEDRTHGRPDSVTDPRAAR